LISGSNTSPALTDPALHNPFYARTAHNDRIQGAIVAEFSLGDDVGAKTAATIADESPYTRDSWVPSRRTSRPAAGR
jgi:ABC-type branched-subunit amino acid transport system substrate-binding protein